MFEPLPSKFDFPAAEKRILEFWDRQDIFAESLRQRADAARFVFYEGPPTANGMPHPGHCLTRAIKDIFPRYKTMCGFLVERKAGWDTHGLPVEREVCKELGIRTKQEIEAFGVEKFNLKCIQSVFRYTREWEEMTRRLGFWVNLRDAYVTFHQSYVESVWWSLKTLFERGVLYQGHKVVWWWAQGGTALSAGEVGEGYRKVDDPSVFVKFPIVEGAEGSRGQGAEGASLGGPTSGRSSSQESPAIAASPSSEKTGQRPVPQKTSLLVWTTTPWTLVSNHFAAVHPDLEYALVHDAVDDEYLYIAAALVETIAKKVKRELVVTSTCKGADLIGLRFVPPMPDAYYNRTRESSFSDAAFERGQAELPLGDRMAELKSGCCASIGWRVTVAAFVTTDSGSGVVHEAPAFGEVDFDLLQDERKRFVNPEALPVLCAVNPDGTFNSDAPERYRGRWVKDCDKDIVRELRDERKTPWGTPLLYHQEVYNHDYPFCPQAPDDPLIQYARRSWFVRTSAFKDEFLKNNAAMNWLPEHIKEGRFGNFLRENVDWALSRERYWGTPLPIWVCEGCGKMEAIGSFDELTKKPGATDGGYWDRKVAEHKGEEFPDHLRVHKPYIDEWTYECGACAGDKGTREQGDKGSLAGGGPVSQNAPRMKRVPEVIDCWWDAGSMPFAQWGFPHAAGSIEKFAQRFPADFISEAQDQTRGWFYGLLAISTLLFGKEARSEGSIGLWPVRSAASDSNAGSIGLWPVRSTPDDSKFKTGVLTKPVDRSLTKRRRILPHWEAGGSTYFVTFRLNGGEMSPDERSMVLDAIVHWHETRVRVHAAIVMPDHVHLIWTPMEREPGVWWSNSDLLHSVKGFTAQEINRRRGESGPVWQREYHDRIIRSQSDFDEKMEYMDQNPDRRGLPAEYPWKWHEEFAETGRSHRPEADAPQHSTPFTHRPEADAPQHSMPFTHRPEADAPQRSMPFTHRPEADAPRRSMPFTHRPEADAPHYPLPYRTCIVLGLIAGEDGNKMSKKLRNYKEPTYIFDSYGADAMRWYFFSAQAPWTSVRFQEAAIRDSQREFLVKLYNVLSFFTIYAKIDGFDPRLVTFATVKSADGFEPAGKSRPSVTAATPAVPSPAPMGWRPSTQRTELDRWIIIELRRTIAAVRESMDRFENYPAAQRLNDFVDALSNWYVRRSRDRFWRPVENAEFRMQNAERTRAGAAGEDASAAPSAFCIQHSAFPSSDQEKWDAYHTLYGCLRVLSRLIAPFTPFFAEEMHQVLRIPEDPISVHLCEYPKPEDVRQLDESLADTMNTVRELVALGRAARTAAKIKVRQPLSLVELILARPGLASAIEDHAALVAEELNVKRVELIAEADKYVTYKVVPNFKAIGAKFRELVPKLKDALSKLADPAAARRTLVDTGALPLEVDGRTVSLTADEVEIRLEAKPGWSAAQGKAGVVVLSTEITPELRDEGVIREFIHFVQAARKDQDLPYEARVRIHVDGPAELTALLTRFEETINAECLGESLVAGPIPAGVAAQVIDVEGTAAKLAVLPLS